MCKVLSLYGLLRKCWQAQPAFLPQKVVQTLSIDIIHFKSEYFRHRRRFIDQTGSLHDCALLERWSAGKERRPMIAPWQSAVRSRRSFVIAGSSFRKQRCGRIVTKRKRFFSFDNEIKRTGQMKTLFRFFLRKDISKTIFSAVFHLKKQLIHVLAQRLIVRISQLDPSEPPVEWQYASKDSK